jgi:hypothetical protein
MDFWTRNKSTFHQWIYNICLFFIFMVFRKGFYATFSHIMFHFLCSKIFPHSNTTFPSHIVKSAYINNVTGSSDNETTFIRATILFPSIMISGYNVVTDQTENFFRKVVRSARFNFAGILYLWHALAMYWILYILLFMIMQEISCGRTQENNEFNRADNCAYYNVTYLLPVAAVTNVFLSETATHFRCQISALNIIDEIAGLFHRPLWSFILY